MSGVYDGLTVVELADRRNQRAGKLLADGGARVIQIEPPAGGPGRWCGPFVDDKVDPDAVSTTGGTTPASRAWPSTSGVSRLRICSGDSWRARTSSSLSEVPPPRRDSAYNPSWRAGRLVPAHPGPTPMGA